MTPCPREGRWIGGCRFEARYDVEPNRIGDYNGPISDLVKVMDAVATKTYVRDVCIRCGKTIERGAE